MCGKKLVSVIAESFKSIYIIIFNIKRTDYDTWNNCVFLKIYIFKLLTYK